MSSIRLIPHSAVQSRPRQGNAGGTAEISWAIADSASCPLPCGFGTWDEAVCEPKTLDYDEVILVLEGTFGVQAEDGTRVEGEAGDVIELNKGSTVTYFGSQAKLFFVIHY